MEGQCKLARKLDDWLAQVATALLSGRGNSAVAPVFLAFLGVLFPDSSGPLPTADASSSDDDDDDDDDGDEAGTRVDDGGGPDPLGSPWKMVGGGQASRMADAQNRPIEYPQSLQSYFVAAVVRAVVVASQHN